ncbi:hypothetical protein MLD38_032057 [Melastoma candidum]|uniref:Uncharacterized protein n=1 Tax=Melastoma candidum TaxID=119954 RepID=A0ACB9M4P7_9MYRT|nr:hypothetical protein MLD38_032057 [Melastoma candidum]
MPIHLLSGFSNDTQVNSMKQSLLDLPSSKTFVKIRNKQCTKLMSGVAIFVVIVVILDEYPDIKSTLRPERFSLHGNEHFYIGVMLMLYSFWFSMIGISALANSLFDLPTPVRMATAASLRGYGEEGDEESMGRRCKIIIRLFVAMVMMMGLVWSIGSGVKLAMMPVSERGLHGLTISVGVAIVVFGITYFMIGLIIIGELMGGIFGPPSQTTPKSKNTGGSSSSDVAANV